MPAYGIAAGYSSMLERARVAAAAASTINGPTLLFQRASSGWNFARSTTRSNGTPAHLRAYAGAHAHAQAHPSRQQPAPRRHTRPRISTWHQVPGVLTPLMAEMTADSVRAGFEELSKYRRPCNVCGRSWSVVKEGTSGSLAVFCAIIHLRGRGNCSWTEGRWREMHRG